MTVFDTHLARLMKCSPPPPHIGVRVVELTGQNEKDKELGEYLGEGTFAPWRIKASVMHTPEQYAARFDELLGPGLCLD